MKRLAASVLASLLALLVSEHASAQATLAWSSEYSDGGTCYASSMKADAEGNVYLTGYDSGATTDMLVMKYDARGILQWVRKYSSGGAPVNSAVSVDIDKNGNVYLAGISDKASRDAAVFKYNKYGDFQWITTFDGPGHSVDQFNKIVVDSGGNLTAVGYSQSSGTTVSSLIVRLDSSGVIQWSDLHNSEGGSIDRAFDLRVDSQGNSYMGGFSATVANIYFDVLKYGPTGALLWQKLSTNPATPVAPGVEIGPGNGVYIVYNLGGGTEAHVALYDSTGALQWDKPFGGYTAVSTTSESTGSVVFTGSYAGQLSVAKIDSTGTLVWGTNVPYALQGEAVTVQGGQTYIAGYTGLKGRNVPTATKLGSNGAVIWNVRSTELPEHNAVAYSIAALPSGLVAIAGLTDVGKTMAAGFYETPVAVNDQYSMTRNTTLTESSIAGVCANDIYATDGTVVLQTDAGNGVLTLNDDGSFTYVPNNNFVGNDSFTYKVYKGQGVSNAATVSIKVQPALTNLTLNPTTVIGGTPTTGTVTLGASAPTGGTVVSLSASSAVIVPPATVTVPAGATTVTFKANTLVVDGTYVRTVTASLNGVSKTASLTLLPPIKLTNLSVSPSTLIGGLNTTGTVTLGAAAPPGGVVVTLSDNSSALTTPASVTVAQGATTATFTIGTSAVAVQATRMVSATYAGVTKTANVTLLPGTALVSLTLNPTTVVGGHPTQGTVTLVNPAPAGGAVVALSANSAVITVPPSVTVAAGSKTATFTANTAKVGATYVRTISATYQAVTKTANLTITP